MYPINYSQLNNKALPVCLALFPIGLLFGILAGQQGINFYQVFLLSTLGFSGSGQFVFLGFYQNKFMDVGYILAFLLILSMNIRYIPMALVNNPQDENKFLRKIVYSHILSDESFTIENNKYPYDINFRIRIYIFLTWVVSTVFGQILASLIPNYILEYLNISFPISTILFTLSFTNITSEIKKSNLTLFVFLFATTVLSFFIVGSKFFWLPAILINYIILRKFR